MIKPSIGRVVWYFPNGKADREAGRQPHPALIAYVHTDTMINIAYFGQDGSAHGRTSVSLEQEPGDADWNSSGFCAWMPYQVGQAKVQAEREQKS